MYVYLNCICTTLRPQIKDHEIIIIRGRIGIVTVFTILQLMFEKELLAISILQHLINHLRLQYKMLD